MKGQVQVYRNLHKTLEDGTKVYSVKNDKGIVEDHVTEIAISRPILRVGPKGNQRVRDEGRKNVHAYIQGKRMKDKPSLADCDKESPLSDWWKVTYNPYKHKHFVLADDDTIRVKSGYILEITTKGVWVFRPSFEKI